MIRTPWLTSDIWIRRSFKLQGLTQSDLKNLVLRIYYDENSTVYINGIEALQIHGYSVNYTFAKINPAAINAIHLNGANELAVHCTQTVGGQGIDVGLDLQVIR